MGEFYLLSSIVGGIERPPPSPPLIEENNLTPIIKTKRAKAN